MAASFLVEQVGIPALNLDIVRESRHPASTLLSLRAPDTLKLAKKLCNLYVHRGKFHVLL